jgi:hypothetical protein
MGEFMDAQIAHHDADLVGRFVNLPALLAEITVQFLLVNCIVACQECMGEVGHGRGAISATRPDVEVAMLLIGEMYFNNTGATPRSRGFIDWMAIKANAACGDGIREENIARGLDDAKHKALVIRFGHLRDTYEDSVFRLLLDDRPVGGHRPSDNGGE